MRYEVYTTGEWKKGGIINTTNAFSYPYLAMAACFIRLAVSCPT